MSSGLNRNARRLTAAALMLAGAAVVAPLPAVAAPASCPGVAADYPAAAAAARACGGRVEALSLRSETDQVWVNPNGSLTRRSYVGAVRFKRAGQWVDIDMTLERKPDGSVGPKASPQALVLSGGHGASDTDLVTFGSGDTQSGLGWSGSLPAPVLSGTTATYPEVKSGVDLVVEATGTGFEQYAVVKNRAALAQVGQLVMPLRTGAARLEQAQDGSLRLRDGKGAVTSAVPAAVMWDARTSPLSGEHLHRSMVPTRAAQDATSGATSLVMTPDAGFLADPGLTFPVTIDPGINGGPQISFDTFVQSGYTDDQSGSTELKLGYSNDGGSWTARSYLSFPGTTFYGAKIYTAVLHLYEWHAWSCPAAGGDHGWQAQMTTGADTNTRWTSQPSWSSYTQTLSNSSDTRGASGCAEGWVSIDVMPSFNVIAGGWFPTVTMGLRGHSETDHNGWKRFYSMNAAANHPYFEVTYDHVPSVGTVTVEGITQCGSGPSGRQYLATTTPTFTAVLGDSDSGQNLTGAVEILQGGTVVQTVPSQQPVGPGQKARFVVTTPLAQGTVYTFRVHSNDGTENSPTTAPCDIQVDIDPPQNPPSITPPADVPAGTPVGFTVSSGFVDRTRVAGYVYGFDPDRLVNTVNAGPFGSAVLPVTVPSVDTPTLYVAAVNHTGARGPLATYDIWPSGNDPTPARTRNDFNGDGRADVIGAADLGGGRTKLYELTTNPAGGSFGSVTLMDEPSAFSVDTIRTVTGDFDGDGRADVAILKQQTGGDVWLYTWRSDGNGTMSTTGWHSQAFGRNWNISAMKVLAGDLNGDGKDDIVICYDQGGAAWTAFVVLSTGAPGTIAFDAPAVWWQYQPGNSDWNHVKAVVADYDGDHRADLIELYDYGNAQTKLWVHRSLTTNTFSGPVMQWDSGPGTWFWSDSKFVSGDINGDGKTDIAAMYAPNHAFNGTVAVAVFLAKADGTGINGPNNPYLIWNSGPWAWDYNATEPITGDYNGDGKADIGLLYHCCGTDQARFSVLPSLGGAFAQPSSYWSGTLGHIGSGTLPADDPNQQYELVAQHSGKCLGVTGAGTGNGVTLQQQTCTDAPQQDFTLHLSGGGQYWVEPSQVSGKCVGVSGGSTASGALITQDACGPTSQNMQLTYLDGGVNSVDALVNIRPMYDGMCLDVYGVYTADGTQIQQYQCLGRAQTNQVFALHRAHMVVGFSRSSAQPE